MKYLGLALIVALIAGCAYTRMTSFTDPSYRGTAFNSAIVFAPDMSLEERMAVENSAVEALTAYNIRAFRGLDISPPTRPLSNHELTVAVQGIGVDTMLVLRTTDKDISQSYVPPTYIPGSTYGTINTLGNTSYINVYQNPGYTIGGYNISKPVASYSATLYEVKTMAVIWKADALSRGNAFANWSVLAKSAAQKAVSRMVADGLFGKIAQKAVAKKVVKNWQTFAN